MSSPEVGLSTIPWMRRAYNRACMNFGLHKNSLFSVLLRSPWWVSALAALAFGILVLPNLI